MIYNGIMTTDETCAAVIKLCQSHEWTLATAESLTAGMISATLCNVPGASSVIRGGVVSYATQVKHDVLGVNSDRLKEFGAVDPVVCEQMAQGACTVMDADVGVAATGVAGPSEQDGHPVGEVHIGVMAPHGFIHRQLQLDGSRNDIRHHATQAAIDLVYQFLQQA